VDYFRSLPRNQKVTLLLDEPERALSVPKQMEMFKLLERMSEEYQIIIATHSPFVLFNINANFINLEEGYDKKCINIFKECVEGLKNV
jgi:predicted ATPase